MFVTQLRNAVEEKYKSYFYYKSMYQLTNDLLWQEFIRHAYEDEKKSLRDVSAVALYNDERSLCQIRKNQRLVRI